jgi:outer membrane protein assembly factor BamB
MRYRFLALGLLLCAPALAADWPGWRGPSATGVSPETNLPTHWSATENVRWKTPLPGAGVSTPVVWKDHVFLTASEGRNDRLLMLAFDRRTGKALWQATFFGSAQPEGYFAPGGMAVPTPATDGKYVYALFGTGDLVCLDFDGKPMWIRSLAEEYGPFRNRWGMGASPILAGDLLAVLVDHFGPSYLLGIEARTGVTRWKTPRDATVNWSSPLAVTRNGQTQLVVSGTFQLRSYAAADGKELWRTHGMMQQCIPTPVADGGILYAVSGRKGVTLAIRLDGARGTLSGKNIVWQSNRGAPFVPSPLCFGGQYYLIDDEGFGSCLDAATGAELWRERIGGRYHASPVAGDGKLYYTNLQGVVTVVKAGPKFEVLARNSLGESVVASPAIAQGQLFIRGEKHLYCIGPGEPQR